TAAAAGRPKGDALATWEQVEEHAAGLHCLAGGAEGPLVGTQAAVHLDRLQGIFHDRLAVDVHRHLERTGERLARRLAHLAARPAPPPPNPRRPPPPARPPAPRRPPPHPPWPHARPRWTAPARQRRAPSQVSRRDGGAVPRLPRRRAPEPSHRRALRVHARRP